MSESAETLLSVTLVTVPDLACARRLAEGLIRTRLAACVNVIDGASSVYRWKGEVTWDNEVVLIVKARQSNESALVDYVLEHHPYENPEVIHLPISGGNNS